MNKKYINNNYNITIYTYNMSTTIVNNYTLVYNNII